MQRIKFWAPVVIWMTVIFLMSSRPRVHISDEETVNFLVFKTLHVLEYAFLFFLTFRAFKFTMPGRKMLLWNVAAYFVTVLYAATDEIHQTFIPTRGGMARDVIIDAGGAILAWILIGLILQKAPQKLRKSVQHLQIL